MKRKAMKQDIEIPKGCRKIHIEVEDGKLTVFYGSRINSREFLCEETGELEERPGIGDFSIFWNHEERSCACCANYGTMVDGMYSSSQGIMYDEAIKFRDYQQFLQVRGIYEG